jgi:hypothetical protein
MVEAKKLPNFEPAPLHPRYRYHNDANPDMKKI